MNTAVASAQTRLEKEIAESSAVIWHNTLPVISAVADQMIALFEILISNSIRFRRQEEAAAHQNLFAAIGWKLVFQNRG